MNGMIVGLRNALKNKLLSFTKLFGVTLSFGVVLFSSAYVYYETSFDKMVPDHDRIFRVIMHGQINGSDEDFAVTSSQMAIAMQEEIPEVDQAVRVKPSGNSSLSYDGNTLYGLHRWHADSGFFDFFGIPIRKAIEGPLAVDNYITISQSLAMKLFGSPADALQKSVLLRGKEAKITGVFDDLPDNFHIQTDIIQTIPSRQDPTWNAQSFHTYFKTHQSIGNLDPLNFKLTKLVYTYSHDEIDGAAARDWSDLKLDDANFIFYRAEPLADIHFSRHKFDPSVTANKTYVYGAVILSILVLIISSLNYVNLTLANLSTRLKEIGIRKTIGAFNSQIAGQFLTESLLFWVLGFALAFLLFQTVGYTLMDYLDLEMVLTNEQLVKLMVGVFVTLLVFNLLTIFLPIKYAASTNVLNLLKVKKHGRGNLSLKTGFLFIQFGLSALIIISAIVVQKQVSYLVNKERGYNTENILMFNLWDLDDAKRESFVNQLKARPEVRLVATSNNYFGMDPSMTAAFFETQNDENYLHTSTLAVDHNFASTFDFDMEKGRFFQEELESDYEGVIINQAAARSYPGQDDLIGKELIVNNEPHRIIGIVRDFNYRSLYHVIQPLVITRTENAHNIYVKVENEKVEEAISVLESQWKEYGVSRPFDYELHDQVIADHYRKDQQAKRLLLILSLISISIACVGLYAISLFTMIRKTKEIGIRKVNGASFRDILVMLNLQFTKWIILAFVVAAPLAWWGMQVWLQEFANRITLQWYVFVGVGLGMLVVSMLTISWQSWHVARKNPVQALRSE